MDPLGLSLLVGFVGAIIGSGITFAWRFSERKMHTIPPQNQAQPFDLALNKFLSLISSSAILINPDDRIVQASAPTYALGIIRGDSLASPELRDLVSYVRRTGELKDDEFDISSRHNHLKLSVRAAPLTKDLVIIFINDKTKEHLFEQVRRDFAANVSHELKTPVGAVMALAETLIEAKEDPAAVEMFATKVGKEAKRLEHLVGQIIELSRLQDAELLGQRSRFDVAGVVAESIDACHSLAEAATIEFVTDIEGGLQMRGERSQVRLAVTNLVENAIAYSKPRSKIAIFARGDEDSISITVTDRGIGIPADELDRIFERFYRLDPSRNTATGGTGLGLSIVKHVMAQHQGEVTVWSEIGEGSSFTLNFPRRKT